MRLNELAEHIGCSIISGQDEAKHIVIERVAGLTQAGPASLSFLSNPAYADRLQDCKASALIVREYCKSFPGPQLQHPDPHFAYARAASLFYRIDHGPLGISSEAIVDLSVQMGHDVRIHPQVTIGAHAVIGDRVVLYPGVRIGIGVRIGADTIVYPNAVLYHGTQVGQRCILHAGCVLGSDGFGFAVSQGSIAKIPQMGRVRIEDDVEIGANSTIDRAANGETIIHSSCKFDNLVHIAHGVEVGSYTMFSAHGGVAGSTKVGRWVLMGGQGGIADHLTIPDGTKIGAQSGLIHSPEKAGTYLGFPAVPQSEWHRSLINLKRVRDLEKRLRDLEQRLTEMASAPPRGDAPCC